MVLTLLLNSEVPSSQDFNSKKRLFELFPLPCELGEFVSLYNLMTAASVQGGQPTQQKTTLIGDLAEMP